MIYSQALLGLHDELVVDLFAGGGGASCGIEMALGRQVDIAVNHDAAAVAMHAINHPQTTHHTCDVFEVDPREVTGGRPVGLLWASPDCTFHSKARGGKPIRSGVKKRRALAWVVTRWAAQVRPRVIHLENVEEFAQWGPLVGPPDALRPCPRRRGRTFRTWRRSLERLGYAVEAREMRASDYGAPTIRKRLFVIARCDGRPIVWPAPTHGQAEGDATTVGGGARLPYRTAAECIDWSIPCPSIFDRAKPLAEATLRRIARGIMRFVVENPRPFVVANNTNNVPRPVDEPAATITTGDRLYLTVPHVSPITHQGNGPRSHSIEEPVRTITTANRGELALVGATLVQTGYGEREGQAPRALDPEAPLGTIVGSQKHALVTAFLAQHNAGPHNHGLAGRPADAPLSTVTTTGGQQNAVVAHLTRFNENAPGASPEEPMNAVVAGAAAHGLVAAHVTKFRTGSVGHAADEPLHTVTGATNTTPGARPGGAAPLGVVSAFIKRDFGTSTGHAADVPLATITTEGGGKASLVAAFLSKYYGTALGQGPGEPLHTVPTVDRFGLVTVQIDGQTYAITDIGMRMLQPRELYNAQGFPPTYIIDRGEGGRRLTKTEQVRMVGNSVCPPMAAALVRANCPEMILRRALPAPPRRGARHAHHTIAEGAHV